MIHRANTVSPFFTLTTLVVVFKKKTVQYKDKIYANFYRKFKLYFFLEDISD